MALEDKDEDILALLTRPKSKRKVRNKVTFEDDATENLAERKFSVPGDLFEVEVPEQVIHVAGTGTHHINSSLTLDEGEKLPSTTQIKDSKKVSNENYVQEETSLDNLSNRSQDARKQGRGENHYPRNGGVDSIAIEDLAKLLQSKLTTVDSNSKFWENRIDDIEARDERNNNQINNLVGKLYETTEKMQVAVFDESRFQRDRDAALRLQEENITIMQRDLERKKDDLVAERREFQSKMEKEKGSLSNVKEAAALRLEELEGDRSRVDYEIQKQMDLSETLFKFSESLMRKAEILSIRETENQCIISEAEQKFEEVKKQKRNLVRERIRILKKKRATNQSSR